MPALRAVVDSFGQFGDLVLPRRCVGCGTAGHALCSDCVDVDGMRRVGGGSLVVWAATGYGGGVRRALVHYKERGRRDLGRPLGELLTRSARQVLAGRRPGDCVLVSVPSAPGVAALRGGDHLARLARQVAVATGVRHARGALTLQRAVLDSADLGATQRAANLDHAMRAAATPGRAAILLDDIVTTGSTLREAARALTAGGWQVGGAAVVAATPRRNRAPIDSAQLTGLP